MASNGHPGARGTRKLQGTAPDDLQTRDQRLRVYPGLASALGKLLQVLVGYLDAVVFPSARCSEPLAVLLELC